jgi:two-component system nitrate/nitrite response regulator NarL
MITIVLADDHPVFLRGFKEILRENPNYLIVGETLQGKEVVELVKTKKPDILLLDLSFTKMHASEIMEELRKTRPETRIIIVTSDDSAVKIETCFENGAMGYIWKSGDNPIDDAIEEVMAGRKFLDPSLHRSFLREFSRLNFNSLEKILLTEKEIEVLKIFDATTCSASEVARRLSITTNTVNKHLASIYNKLDVSNKISALRVAKEKGIL